MTELLVRLDTEPIDIVRYYFPEFDDEDIDWLLWNHTRWPYGPIVSIGNEVYEYYLKNKR